MEQDRPTEPANLERVGQCDTVLTKTIMMKFYETSRNLAVGLNIFEAALIAVYLATLIILLIGFY